MNSVIVISIKENPHSSGLRNHKVFANFGDAMSEAETIAIAYHYTERRRIKTDTKLDYADFVDRKGNLVMVVEEYLVNGNP